MMVPAVELGERCFTTWCLVGRVELPKWSVHEAHFVADTESGHNLSRGEGGRHRGDDYPSCGRFRERFQKHSKRPSFRTFHHSCTAHRQANAGGKAEGRDVASSCSAQIPLQIAHHALTTSSRSV